MSVRTILYPTKVDESPTGLSAELAAARAEYEARRQTVVDTATRKQSELRDAIAEFELEAAAHDSVLAAAKSLTTLPSA